MAAQRLYATASGAPLLRGAGPGRQDYYAEAGLVRGLCAVSLGTIFAPFLSSLTVPRVGWKPQWQENSKQHALQLCEPAVPARRLKGKPVKEGYQDSTYGVELWAGQAQRDLSCFWQPCERSVFDDSVVDAMSRKQQQLEQVQAVPDVPDVPLVVQAPARNDVPKTETEKIDKLAHAADAVGSVDASKDCCMH